MNVFYNPIFIFLAFFLALLIVVIIKKIYFRVRYHKRYYFLPRTSVKGIASIAMVISISIAIIIMLTIFTADLLGVVFRAWPGTRVTIEGILIKIGGLLFGPVLGMFIGALTDLLTIALTAGVFHYGYLISSIAFGLISGLIADIFKNSYRKNYQYAIWSTITLIFIDILVIVFLQLKLNSTFINIEFLSLDIHIETNLLIGIIVGLISLGIIFVWIGLIYYNKKVKNSNSFKTQRQKFTQSHWYYYFTSILSCVIVTDALINVLMMPQFDAQLSTLTVEQWITIRGIIFGPEIIFNFILIFPIYKVIFPIVNYDYRQDLIEDYKLPVYIN